MKAELRGEEGLKQRQSLESGSMRTVVIIKMAKGKMTFVEKITMSPFEKYAKFGRFPYKFVLHLLLIVFVSALAISIVDSTENHARVQQQVFSTVYLDTDDGSNSVPFYSIVDFKQHLQGVFKSTQELDEILLQYTDTNDLGMQLSVYYQYQTASNFQHMVYELDPSEGTIHEPFELDDNLSIKTFLSKIQSMTLSITGLVTTLQADQGKIESCLNWTVNIDYSFESYANVQADLQAFPQSCQIQGQIVGMGSRAIILDSIVVILALTSLILAWRGIYQYGFQKYQYQNKSSLLGEQVQRIDREYLDIWFFIGVTGNFLQFIGGLVSILSETLQDTYQIFEAKQTLVGFGTMFAWVTILKYLQYIDNMNLMTGTLGKAWKNIGMFLLGVFPFFLGFVFLGQCIFWKYNKFQDTTSTIITLFSLSNGDIVNDTFLQTWAQGFLGQLYLILFMVLFYTAVQNVFITIIMEGYQQSIKQKEKKASLRAQQELQRSRFQKALLQGQAVEEQPEGQSHQHILQKKLQVNVRRMERVLNQMQRVVKQVQESGLPVQQQRFLMDLLDESLENLIRSIKFQMHSLA